MTKRRSEFKPKNFFSVSPTLPPSLRDQKTEPIKEPFANNTNAHPPIQAKEPDHFPRSMVSRALSISSSAERIEVSG